MAAVYPGAVKSFGSPVADAVDTVYAAHVNDLRDEVVAVETELGTGLKSSTWTGAWANTASWSNLAARLTNIERGIVTTSDVHTQYVKKAGDAMTGALDMGNQKITGLQAGAATNDVVNYGQVILRSGVNAMSANLNMGTTYKITNLANGSVSTDALAYGQVLASGTTLISGLFSGTNPVMDGTAAVGSSAQPARSDHVHPSDTSKLNTSGGTLTGTLTMSGAIAMGSNKITGLAAGTTAGDAVRYEQALLLAGGTMAGAIAMGGSKVTGLAAATANGDAVRYEQITPKLDSARVTSGVWAGTTDASGDATITLPTSPTGNWAVTLTPKPDSFSDWRTAHIKAVTSTSVSFRLFKFNVSVVTAATSDSTCDVHYIAVAY